MIPEATALALKLLAEGILLALSLLTKNIGDN